MLRLLPILFLCCTTLSAQQSPRAALAKLFAGMRAADTTGLGALFLPGATITTVGEQGGARTVPVTALLDNIAGSRPASLDEQLHRTQVRTDGALATIWAPYTFVLDGRVHHCGTNAFQLVRDLGGTTWRIANVTDTRRTEGCAEVDPRPDSLRIAQLATRWHAAAASADSAAFFGAMTDDAVYIGTDPGEHWARTDFLAFAAPYFAAGKAWAFTATERHVFTDPDRSVAYWDELLDTWMGPCRGTAVVRLVEGRWRIAHYTLSMTVPNARVEDVMKAVSK